MRESEEKFSKTFRASPVALSLARSKDGVYVDVNECFLELYGLTRDEVVGKGILDVGLWMSGDHTELLHQLQNGPRVRNREVSVRAKNGKLRALLISAELVEIDGELCSLISTVDITALKQAQEASLAEKTLTDAVFATMPGLLFLLDEQGNCIRWNKQAERLTGYSAREIANRNIFDLHVNKERILEMFRNVPHAGHAEFETELRMKDGTQIPFYCTAAYVLIDGSRYLVEVGIDITERRRAEQERLGLSSRLISAQDEERSRIARELHDDVSQKLALVGIELEQLLQSESLKAGFRSKVLDMKTKTLELASTLHNLSREIHPSNLSRLGFRIALQGLSRDMKQRGLTVQLNCHDIPNSLPPDVSLCLFRVAQEALNNVLTHSGVKEAQLEAVGDPGGVRLVVLDSGNGFDPQAKEFQAGLGLLSMKERIRLVGGEFSLRRRPQGGMEVTARVPLHTARMSLSA
jgi:PAS domain S-box-containing protein